MKKYVIIVAGGKGLRMGGEVPKQFLPIGGKPVLMRTVEAFYQTDAETGIVLVLPQEQQSYWKNLCCQYDFRIPYILADGGCTRFHSVRNGLQVIPDEDSDSLIAVHDGVRPFVSPRVIQECFEAATRWGAVVPVLDMVDSVRQLSEDGSSMAVDRSCLKLVQKAVSMPYRLTAIQPMIMTTSMDGFTKSHRTPRTMREMPLSEDQAVSVARYDSPVSSASLTHIGSPLRPPQQAAR